MSFPLAKYAAQYWIIHAHSGSKATSQSALVFALMMKLLTEKNTAFVNWVQLYNIDHMFGWYVSETSIGIAGPLYYASLAGFTEASHALLKRGAVVNSVFKSS